MPQHDLVSEARAEFQPASQHPNWAPQIVIPCGPGMPRLWESKRVIVSSSFTPRCHICAPIASSIKQGFSTYFLLTQLSPVGSDSNCFHLLNSYRRLLYLLMRSSRTSLTGGNKISFTGECPPVTGRRSQGLLAPLPSPFLPFLPLS